ncbi:MAG: hypothetical protein ACI8T1_004996 [Verrucomicrobiales bacterium]|jgi:hypothetical protein
MPVLDTECPVAILECAPEFSSSADEQFGESLPMKEEGRWQNPLAALLGNYENNENVLLQRYRHEQK